ncbi:RsmE family RNA methyltransferase [Candidatus Nucleicultrix amoebiphila]|jgi:16S rRNA (uracil1498-N3)-methyltransferase|uniref:Ribosomal RNA small subunit methyltransferase E n=1 Tax=Candidatus Nucleicultrix amoebiphila FS5 TaxID=1414854 RepID=A0A1W6N372_9PROT|nr:RsmE family RNA methyltransferase [Candidatus Nucleicultrix amoebiphila]ARN84295.1 hypothetical protein GQ61_01915 [Candidatus Nucleicultrix amoebiphila FS5]
MAQKSPRIYVPGLLSTSEKLPLGLDQYHYVHNVLRLKEGDALRLFNNEHGDWLATILSVKKQLIVELKTQLRKPSPILPVHLISAPIKKYRLSYLIEKATELGISDLHFVKTDYTNQPTPRLDKLRLTAIEAAEQSERLSVPTLHEQQPIRDFLASWPQNIPVFVGDERRDAPPLVNFISSPPSPAGILIGPEGGFSSEEFDFFQSLPFVTLVKLSSHILRAETAVAAALAIWLSKG